MIRQTIFFNDDLLLTIIHKHMDSGIDSRLVSDLEITAFGELKFVEELLEEVGDITYDEINQGFLENQNKKNPYYSYSVNFTEFIKYDKPLFEDDQLTIDHDNFQRICDFIEEKTGYKIIENPFSIGNIIVFEPNKIEINYFRYKDNISGIEVKGLSSKSTTIIKFKNENIVNGVYIKNGCVCKITPEYEWSSLDLEVYEDNKIVHAVYDVYLMRSLYMDIIVPSKKMNTELETHKKSITINSSSSMPVFAGENLDSKLIKYLRNESIFKRQLINDKIKNLHFLGKGESKKAFEIFEKIMDSKCNEIWIFDPYFINYDIWGGVKHLRDIFKILIKNIDVKKNIVFESHIDKVNLNDFINKVSDDKIKSIAKSFNGLNIEFKGTSEHFHDRFFFLEHQKYITGYLIGTSLNSFGENYSTLIKLKQNEAKFIFDKLINEVVLNKIKEKVSL